MIPMDGADDTGLSFGEFQKRTVPQTDLLPAVGCPALGSEAKVVKHRDQVVDRLLGVGTGRRRFELAPPRPARGQRHDPRIPFGGKATGEDLGKQPVTPRPSAIRPPDRPKHQRRAPRSAAAGLDPLHLAISDQVIEVEADGVGMHAQLAGDRGDAHRNPRRTQCPQHRTTAPHRLLQ